MEPPSLLSVVVRVVLLILLILILLARRHGWIRKYKNRRLEKAQEQEKQQQLVARKERRKEAAEQAQLQKRQTAELLRQSVPNLQLKSVEVLNQEIHYLEGGPKESERELLLLHGFAGEKENWGELAALLAEQGWRVVAPDLPGFGQNLKDPNRSYDVTTQVKRIRTFAHYLRLQHFHIAGCSIGGTIAAAYAYSSPGEIRSLTLVEPFGVRVPYKSELDELVEQERNPMVIATPEAYDNLLGFLYATPPELPPALKQYRAKMAAENRSFYLKLWQEIRHGDRANLLDLLLPEIRHKTLVILGGDSKVIHGTTAEVIQTMMPDRVQTVTIASCGHFPMAEKPRETASHLFEFLHYASQAAAPEPPPEPPPS